MKLLISIFILLFLQNICFALDLQKAKEGTVYTWEELLTHFSNK